MTTSSAWKKEVWLKMKVNVIISDDPFVGLQTVELEHLLRILKFQVEEKGKELFGELILIPKEEAKYSG